MDLDANQVSLTGLLGDRREQFQVPPYQRPYAWQSEQIDELWDDLVSGMGDGHFVGSVVLSVEDRRRPQIIDGQQRLTTLLLLLGLIRDEYHRLGCDLADRIQDLMYADRYVKGDDSFKVRLGDANWRIFRDGVLRSPNDEKRVDLFAQIGDPEERDRNVRMIENARRLRDRLHQWLEGLDEAGQRRRLEDLEMMVAEDVSLVAIRVGTIGDAFLLFETLNDRGLQLSAADLLKNHLLSQVAKTSGSDDEVRRMAREWDRMLDDLGSSVDVSRFFRHFLLVRIPAVSKDGVYDQFKKTVNEAGAEPLLEELRVAAKAYGTFEDPGRISSEEPDAAHVLWHLKTLRAASCYVLLLPARRWLTSEQFTFVARLAEILTYRHSSIAGLDNKNLERAYHRAAKLLDESKGDAFDEAIELLVGSLPDRETFLNGFMRQRMGVQYLVRYTLREIEKALSPGHEKLKDGSTVHIEHIMPQTLTDEWRQALGPEWHEHEDRLNRWGNLTFLWYRLNSGASNLPFAEKKKYYEASDVALTRRLCDLDQWGFDAIEERQLWLGEMAERIWSIDALRGEMGDLPAAPAPSPVSTLGLTPDVAAKVRELATESSFHELLEQRARVIGHLSVVEIEWSTNPDIDFHTAKRITDALQRMIERSADLDGEQRALVRGAVEYFVLTDDVKGDLAGPDGFGDDAAVVEAVAVAVGLDGIRVHTG